MTMLRCWKYSTTFSSKRGKSTLGAAGKHTCGKSTLGAAGNYLGEWEMGCWPLQGLRWLLILRYHHSLSCTGRASMTFEDSGTFSNQFFQLETFAVGQLLVRPNSFEHLLQMQQHFSADWPDFELSLKLASSSIETGGLSMDTGGNGLLIRFGSSDNFLSTGYLITFLSYSRLHLRRITVTYLYIYSMSNVLYVCVCAYTLLWLTSNVSLLCT